MSEAGGPTTQSGIIYQNSIAARYLGRLCDPRDLPARDRVINVRVEAPSAVDDIVVTYADGHREWIHAKENISPGSESWRRLWRDFEEQRLAISPDQGDSLIFVTGSAGQFASELREMSERAASAENEAEWINSLSRGMVSLLGQIQESLSAERVNAQGVFTILSRLQVEIVTLDQLQRDQVRYWIPEANVPQQTLFRILRDMVGGHSRYRRAFRAVNLLKELDEQHRVSISETTIGVRQYREAVERLHARIEVPGTQLAGSITDLLVWPTIKIELGTPSRFMLAFDEDELFSSNGELVELERFPDVSWSRAVLVAGAGFGKTTLLRAIAHSRARSIWLPVVVPLAELADYDETILDYLIEVVNSRFAERVPWKEYCESGRCLLLFDGLDELSTPDRARVLARINEFSARFPDSPWLLAVRDAGALAAPVAAPLFFIEPLDEDEVERLMAAYVKGIGLPTGPIELAITQSPELRRLSRIPLFLVLLIARYAANPTESLPRRRSALLETYLETLLNPAMHKPAVVVRSPTGVLRAASERLAFVALDAGTPDVSEHASRKAVESVFPAQADSLLQELLVCGVIRRAHHRIAFVFPIVQEYLAGIHLAERRADEIVIRFEGAVTRPWAQALQFAIENLQNAEPTIQRLLATPDDAFGTLTRVIARCIVNGARVSATTRQGVAEKLAAIWTTNDTDIARSAAQLLGDGFLPLPTLAQNALRHGYGLYTGAEELIASAKDQALALAFLEAILRPEWAPYHLRECQPLMDEIAPRVMSLYLARSRDARSPHAIYAYACLVQGLNPISLGREAMLTALRDSSLHDVVRLAVAKLSGFADPTLSLELIDHVILSEHEYKRLALESCWEHPQGRTNLWKKYLWDSRLTRDSRREVLFSIAGRMTRPEALVEVQSLVPPSDLELARLLTLAYLDDRQAMCDAADRLADAHEQDVGLWIELTSKYQDEACVARGLGSLERRTMSWAERSFIASRLAYALTYEIKIVELHYMWQHGGKRRHPATSHVISLIEAWMRHSDCSLADRLSLYLSLHILGVPNIAEPIRKSFLELEATAKDEDDVLLVSVLDSFRDELGNLAMPILYKVALREGDGAARAIRLIPREQSIEGLDMLLALHESLENSALAGFALDEAETLALRLGVRVIRDKDGHLKRV